MDEPGSGDRRHWLRLAAATAGAAWLPRWAWSQPPPGGDNPFALGVASGSPAADSVVLWTRLADERLASSAVTVRWELARDAGFSRIRARGQAQALPALGHAVHVESGGLEADSVYFYRFHAGGWTSPTGRTRTLPAPGAPARPLRIAYASCQRWEHGWFSAWRHMRADAPDLVLFLGDYIYEYPGAAHAVRPVSGGWVQTLADYRARYALYRSDADLQAMHAACPWLPAWDDHEVHNDYAGLQEGQSGPVPGDFPGRRSAAYQAWYENMPVRAEVLDRALAGVAGPGAAGAAPLAPGAPLRMHARYPLGALGDLYLLDCRQYRGPQACTPGGRPGAAMVDPAACPGWNDPARSMLGLQQERWLEQSLQSAGGGWSILGQSTLFGPRDAAPGPATRYWNDGWDGYPAARRRLAQALGRHCGGRAVVLGGDVHENWVGEVKEDYARPDSRSVGVEFCGTSISSRGGRSDRLPALLAENPHFAFADAERRGYGLLDLAPERLELSLRALHDVERPDSGIFTLARFGVEAARPRLERL